LLKYKVGFAALVVVTIACIGWVAVLLVGVPNGSRDTDAEHPGTPAGQGRPEGVPPDAEPARVAAHVDGDTVHLRGDRSSRLLEPGEDTSVRLLEIDTPESVDPDRPVQCFAHAASRALQRLIPRGSTVWVAPDQELLDPYGRTLLYLWTPDGMFVNEEMVSQGLARAVLFEPNDEHIRVLRRAEASARANDAGLWHACDYFGQPVSR
jgi:micrococcal nuclease